MRKNVLPVYRYDLRAQIAKSKFRKMSDLAQKAKVHPSVISRILSGHELPAVHIQKQLAKALKISMSELAKLL